VAIATKAAVFERVEVIQSCSCSLPDDSHGCLII
jgi:hypothetical protein